MNAFQIMGLSLLAVLITVSIVNIVRGRGRVSVSVLWLSLWCLGAVALVQPEATVLVARSLGVKRGADLVFYCNVFATLGGFFLIYLRQRRIEHNLTLLVREVALARPHVPEERVSSPGGTPA
jgi:hypothetical protein